MPLMDHLPPRTYMPWFLLQLHQLLRVDAQMPTTKTIDLWNASRIGGTQTLFRNLPKVSNFGKTLGPSCSGSKIVPTHKFWVHGHILESSNRIQRLEIIDWDKYPLKWFFSKTVGAIVISVQRSSGFPNFIQIHSIFLVFFVSWSSAFLKIGNHGIDFNSKYIFRNQDIYKIV